LDFGQCVARTVVSPHVCDQFCKVPVIRGVFWYGGLISGCVANVSIQLRVGYLSRLRWRRWCTSLFLFLFKLLLQFDPVLELSHEWCNHVETVVPDKIVAVALGLIFAFDGR
jgi:hypothetical protein